MEQTPEKSTGKKLYWGVAVVLTLVGLLWGAALNLEGWATQKLQDQVHAKSKGLYQLQIKKLDLSLLAGSATLDSVILTPDRALWQRVEQKSPQDAPASLAWARAERVRVQGLNFLKLLLGRDLHLGTIILEQPALTWQEMKKDTTSQPLHERAGPQLQGLRVRQVQVKNGRFQYRALSMPKTERIALAGITGYADDWQLDSASYADPARAYYCKSLEVIAQKGTLQLPDGNYQLRSEAVRVDTRQQQASLRQLQLVPLRSARAMSRRAGKAVTRFNVRVPEVQLTKLDFRDLFQNSNLSMGRLVLQNPRVSAFKDGKNFVSRGSGLLPHDLVRQLSFGLNILQAEVRNLAVRYEELAEKAFQTGYVMASNIDLSLSNLTNDPRLNTVKKPAVLKARGLLMGKAKLEATVKMALLDPNGHHSMEGNIGGGNPAILNPILEPSMFVRVKSGYLQKGAFQMELTKTSARGSIQLQYDNFKVDLLNKSPERKQSLGKKLKTLVANKLVLKSESEQDGKAPRQGTIQVTRKHGRSFLAYWKDCLANGVLSVIGAPT
ncbi:hypothetical protein EFA69_05490 [Rufibacter immobilis]|uniref:DUF748 domain-containing protein n=1 Tax=Rufibacter immobilis TaxID=1348778 RepID=A0A3M9N2E6_9BACT|nr:hypothetical protein [Rufibacter immobilis]RNI31960.1 hypothetical protein EFA69_05490 [Rufibacter immobilis]